MLYYISQIFNNGGEQPYFEDDQDIFDNDLALCNIIISV